MFSRIARVCLGVKQLTRLYDFLPSGNGYKVRLLLTQLETPFDWVNLNILEGETRTQKFIEKNANGRIPLLELDDGRFIAESNAILYYLATGTPYFPEDQYLQSQVLQWMFFEQYSHEPYIAVSRFIHEFSPPGDERFREVPALHKKGYAALDVMNQHLSTQDFFVANTYTIADIALYAYTHVAHEGGFDLAGYSHINRWLSKVAKQDRHIDITQDKFG